MRDVLVAGHYCHDVLVSDAGERSELGGSAAYAAAVLRSARVDFAVVTKVGDDFLYAHRVPAPRVIAGARTTSFVAQWSGDDERIGAGSQVLTVGVGRKYRHR